VDLDVAGSSPVTHPLLTSLALVSQRFVTRILYLSGCIMQFSLRSLRARRGSVRPQVELLEDRLQPSGLGAVLDFQAGAGPAGVVRGDFNRDGYQDLATTNFLSNSVSILINNGNGTFGSGQVINGFDFPGPIATGDFNRDGKLDLAVGNSQSNTVTILLGNGSGAFHKVSNVLIPRGPGSIAVGDFNRDGKLDLVITAGGGIGSAGGTVNIRLGNGNGTFRNGPNISTSPNPTSVAVGYINADRILDLAIGHGSGNSVDIRLGNGNGTFRNAPAVVVDSSSSQVALGDFSGDGKVDLAAASSLTNTVSIRLGNGNGTFSYAPTLLAGPAPGKLVISDINHDGRADLTVVNSGDTITTAGLGIVDVFISLGRGGFRLGSRVTTGDQSGDVALGDFNRDGKLDFATVNFNSNNVSVARGLGNGKFLTAVPATTTPFPNGQEPSGLVIGDFNNDGNPDVLVANSGTSNVDILLGNGNGSFSQPITGPVFVGSVPLAIVSGDFNHDGKLDFLTANSQANTVSVRLGNGNGAFTNPAPTDVPVGTTPFGVAVGDFNHDNVLDFATANLNSGNVSIRLGNGDGTFHPGPQAEIAIGIKPSAVAVGDFNHDNIPDLAVTTLTGTLHILIGNGNGTFTELNPPLNVGLAPRSIAVSDLNGDGKLDLVIANAGSNNVSVLFGNGNGTFVPAVNYFVGISPIAVTAADVNGDGILDLVTADNGYTDVSVLLGNVGGTFQSALDYLAGPTPTGVGVADFNKDGKPDVAVSLFGSDGINLLLGTS
jgi:hypothetical protein